MRDVEASGSTAGIDAKLGDLPRQVGRRVEVRERRRRRRVRVVVGRHVDRLHRGDRALLRRRDALLHLAHLREQRRLVADRRRHAAEQRRHLGAGLREPEDVVDEEEHVLAFGVAEVLGDRQRREADAQARARRLRHLSVDQRGARLREVLGVDDARLLELEPEVVAFTRAFADAAEHRHAAVLHGDVVDQLHDDDGLADAGAAEQADLAALQVRLEQVDDLDAGLEHASARSTAARASGLRDGSASAPSTAPGRSGKSTGSPSTLSTRPSVSGPTGTEIGAPVSIAVMPRVMPSVGFIATVRTRFSPRCCSTSATTSIFSTPGPPSDTIRTAL